MDLITIKDAANELNVTVQTIYKWIKEKNITLVKKENNRSFLKAEDFQTIKAVIEENAKSYPAKPKDESTVSSDIIEGYRTQIEDLKSTVVRLNNDITELNNKLDNVNADYIELKSTSDKTNKEYIELQKNHAVLEERIKGLDKEKNGLTTSVAELKTQQEKERKEHTAALERYRRDIKQLSDNLTTLNYNNQLLIRDKVEDKGNKGHKPGLVQRFFGLLPGGKRRDTDVLVEELVNPRDFVDIEDDDIKDA